MTFNTGNPVGSTDARNLYDNAQILDRFVNGEALVYPDRLGVERKSLAGMETDFADRLGQLGYVRLGDYAAGLVIADRRQVFLRAGEFYRAAAALTLPYTTTGDWVSESSSFVGVGDAVLRQDLSSPTGTDEIGRGAGTLESALDALESASAANAQAVQDVDGKVDSLNGTTLGYSQNTGVRAENLAAALDFLGRSGREGIFTTPASLGHRAGSFAYRIESGGKARLISDLSKYYPAGAFATPATASSLGLKAYYVKVDGLDTNDGLGWSTALQSVATALAKTDVDIVFVKAGVYMDASHTAGGNGQHLGTYTGTRNVSIQAVGGRVVFMSAPAQSSTEWLTTGAANVYRKTGIPTSIAGVCAFDYQDEYGLPLLLTRRADTTEVANNPGSFVLIDSDLFISMPDNSVPGATRVKFYNPAPMRMAAPGVKFHHRGITYVGGDGGGFSARLGNASSVVISEGIHCVGASNGDAYQVQDIGLSIAIDCIVASANKDGFNYHEVNGLAPHFIEVNCIGVKAQTAGTGNGSTAHETCIGVRVGCDYAFNLGPGVADVNDARSYNVCCTSRANGPSTNAAGFIAQADAATGEGATMWLHCCSSGDNAGGDVSSRVNAKVYVRDTQYRTSVVDQGGALSSF